MRGVLIGIKFKCSRIDHRFVQCADFGGWDEGRANNLETLDAGAFAHLKCNGLLAVFDLTKLEFDLWLEGQGLAVGLGDGGGGFLKLRFVDHHANTDVEILIEELNQLVARDHRVALKNHLTDHRVGFDGNHHNIATITNLERDLNGFEKPKCQQLILDFFGFDVLDWITNADIDGDLDQTFDRIIIGTGHNDFINRTLGLHRLGLSECRTVARDKPEPAQQDESEITNFRH